MTGAQPTAHPTADAIRAKINEIVDPCSRAAGIPAGLVDMGLLRSLELAEADGGVQVHAVVGVTEYACMLGPAFATAIHKLVSAMDGVISVHVELDSEFDWEPEDMSPSYQAALTGRRKQGNSYFLPLRRL